MYAATTREARRAAPETGTGTRPCGGFFVYEMGNPTTIHKRDEAAPLLKQLQHGPS